MKGRLSPVVLVLAVLITVATVRAQDSVWINTEPMPRLEPLSIFERSFKPSFYDNEVYLYSKSDTAKQFGATLDQVTTAPPETLQGFRIQLLSTNNFDEALTLRNQLNEEYPQVWVYTVYETPMYKIRVGDYINRSDAKYMLDSLQAAGYPSAWIVPDLVIKNLPPKPPLPTPIDSTLYR